MKRAFVSLATAALLVARAVGQGLTINTPSNVVFCQPLQITWSGGTAPYFLTILPGGDPTGTALESFPSQSGTSYTWLVDIQANTSIDFTIRDSSGTLAQSAPVTVNAGLTNTCSSSTTSGSTTAASASGSTSAATSSGTATTPSATVTTTSASKGTTTTSPATLATTKPATTGSSSSSASSSATSSHNAGPTQAAPFGVAGIVGAAVIALLA